MAARRTMDAAFRGTQNESGLRSGKTRREDLRPRRPSRCHHVAATAGTCAHPMATIRGVAVIDCGGLSP
jgi:hypothetical protein